MRTCCTCPDQAGLHTAGPGHGIRIDATCSPAALRRLDASCCYLIVSDGGRRLALAHQARLQPRTRPANDQGCATAPDTRNMNGGTREPAHPAQSNELLGLPRDARVLIINADDFGMYPAVNAAVVRSIEEGIASSCSLMTPCPAAPQAMDLLRQHPRISFGIHLTLVCDIPSIRWGPLAAREEVSSLLSETGELFTPRPASRAARPGSPGRS